MWQRFFSSYLPLVISNSIFGRRNTSIQSTVIPLIQCDPLFSADFEKLFTQFLIKKCVSNFESNLFSSNLVRMPLIFHNVFFYMTSFAVALTSDVTMLSLLVGGQHRINWSWFFAFLVSSTLSKNKPLNIQNQSLHNMVS